MAAKFRTKQRKRAKNIYTKFVVENGIKRLWEEK